MFNSILVPVDIAQRSSWQFALPQGIELAAASGGSLTVITVVREPSVMFESVYFPFQLEKLIEDARSRLASIVAEHRAEGVRLSQDVRFGSIGREILSAAKDCAADLILMASHRPEILDYLIGPNAAYVAQNAPCSVLVLRRYATGEADEPRARP